MQEEQLQHIAAQLRKPEGEAGKKTGEMMNTGNRLINLSAIDALDLRPGQTILEIGMGNGYFVRELFGKEKDLRYYGCDYSELMVGEARALNAAHVEAGSVEFIHSAADDLPFQDTSLDTIFTVNTVYFWERPEKVLAEFRRVLKPGGRLVLGLRPKSSMRHYPFVRYGFTMYSPEELRELLEQNGFRVERISEHEEPEQEIAGEKVAVGHMVAVGISE